MLEYLLTPAVSGEQTNFHPLDCTQEQLLVHIVKGHLSHVGLHIGGLPLYDIDLAMHRGFHLQMLADAGSRLIQMTDAQLAERSALSSALTGPMGPIDLPQEKYRVMVARTLAYAHKQGMLNFDLSRFGLYVPLDLITPVQPCDSHDSRGLPRAGYDDLVRHKMYVIA